MGRPQNRADLLVAAESELARLLELVERVPASDRERPGACEDWSVKDLLAHLAAWQEMALGWAAAGDRGERPAIPAPGYTWTDVPALNERIHQAHRDDPWDDVVARLERGHAACIAYVEAYPADELFVKRRVPWTGTTSVGSYFTSATSSHYAWAAKLVRAWLRRQAPV